MTDTVDVQENVTDGVDLVDAPEESRFPAWVSILFAFGALAGLALGASLFLVRLPYFVLEPGNTFETEEFIEVEGTDSYTSPGEVSFVTVTQRRISPADWLISQLQGSDEIIHEDLILGGRTLDEQREENALLMLSSQSTAIAAALNHLGFMTLDPAGIVVIDIVEGGPLDGVLARNDVITEVDGEPISTLEELAELIESSQSGDTFTALAGRPGETPREVEIVISDYTSGFLGIARDVSAAPDAGAVMAEAIEGGPSEGLLEANDNIVSLDGTEIDSFETLVGELGSRRAGETVAIEVLRDVDGEETLVAVDITLGTRLFERAGFANLSTQFRDADLPISVNFTTEDIGGPSAGLAFTLTVLDVLTEGDLTGGANIVVTGAIDRDGTISAIGGAHQKAFAAIESDADIFIVPEANLATAQAARPDLRVESAANLTEALEIIAEFGGNSNELPMDGQL